MLQLFLCEPAWGNDNTNDESYKLRRSLLDELESIIWSFMSSVGRSEARLWLCNTLSGISSISPRRQRDLFLSLLRSKPIKRHLASQLLQLIFEKQPQKMGPIIAKKSHKLENFFKGNPRRILQWFSNFTGSGGVLDYGKGAKALSQFAFVNRDICWEELEWKGKHGQSPAMVATKPHYFLDLDVQRTVENFLGYVPEFWSSHEFSESLKDGSILLVDTKYFVNLFTDFMYKEELEEVWEVIEEFLMEQSFSFLCHHLLIILEEQDLHLFLDLIPKYLKPKSESESIGFGNASEWVEIILSKYSGSRTINQLLLLNAVTNQSRQLLRLVQEEGSVEEKGKIKNLVFQLCESSSCANDLASMMEVDLKRKSLEFIKCLGVQSWAIYFRLLEEFHSAESWASLFISNGIKFRKSDKYAFLHDDECSEDSGLEDYDRSVMRLKHKKHKKKRKRNPAADEDELVDCNLSDDRIDMQSMMGDWLLSTDGYSTTWSSIGPVLSSSKYFLLRRIKNSKVGTSLSQITLQMLNVQTSPLLLCLRLTSPYCIQHVPSATLQNPPWMVMSSSLVISISALLLFTAIFFFGSESSLVISLSALLLFTAIFFVGSERLRANCLFRYGDRMA